ncbi:MAG: NADH-quinone oxidoreductase subunit N [Deltaproteobacteria bacterium]|nr:NADH-quinone oxidoreductase subunit N [Deltaproteobacteria bacterium]
MLFLPELTLLGAGLTFFIFSLGKPNSGRIRNMALSVAAIIFLASMVSIGSEGTLFYNSYKIDLFSQLFKALIALATFIVLIFSGKLDGIKDNIQSEYYLFLFMSVFGLMMLVSSVELISIFVSLELSSFAVYLMVPMRKTGKRGGPQVEAGIKYLLYGVVATGLMLYGMSYMYGLTGSTHLDEITDKIARMYNQPAAVIAVLLVLTGFFYKLALVPLHFWVPDVYEGASNETTAFIATVPKLAAVALLIRIVTLVTPDGNVMTGALMVCAIASMFYGNLSALVQTDIKRLLGFSGISHAGFVLLGLLTFNLTGYATAIYYIAGYVFMNLACFLVICTVARDGENVLIEDLTGLHKRAPLLALTLTVGLFGLAGIPPLVGFAGKFMLLVAALKEGYLLLVTLAAINTAIAIYYYLSIVRVTFCTDDAKRTNVVTGRFHYILCFSLMLIIIIMGVIPQRFIDIAVTAVQTLV